jgi:hypothetical protein
MIVRHRMFSLQHNAIPKEFIFHSLIYLSGMKPEHTYRVKLICNLNHECNNFVIGEGKTPNAAFGNAIAKAKIELKDMECLKQ